jgi:hypothetical protein
MEHTRALTPDYKQLMFLKKINNEKVSYTINVCRTVHR